MAYLEIPNDPGLTLEQVKQKLQGQLPGPMAAILRNRIVLVDDGAVGVAVHLMQTGGGSFLRVERVMGRGVNIFLRFLMIAIPPLGMAILLIGAALSGKGLFRDVENTILKSGAFPGAVRLPAGEGTRRARPGLYRLLGFCELAGGLIVTAFSLWVAGRLWYGTQGMGSARPAALFLSRW